MSHHTESINNIFFILDCKKRPSIQSPPNIPATLRSSKSQALLWGATGEQEWTPALTTGKIT